MNIRLAAPLQKNSIVDGEGIRAVIWTQGCTHNCLACHNPDTHDLDGGFSVDIEELKKEIKNLNEENGITLSGGDPFCQVKECYEIAKFCHSIGLNVWCYTGYVFENLLKMAEKKKKILHFLEEIDVLIDGPFILKERSFDVKFRGSKNQRIIDVRKSLKEGKTIEIEKYKYIAKQDPEVEKKVEIYI